MTVENSFRGTVVGWNLQSVNRSRSGPARRGDLARCWNELDQVAAEDLHFTVADRFDRKVQIRRVDRRDDILSEDLWQIGIQESDRSVACDKRVVVVELERHSAESVVDLEGRSVGGGVREVISARRDTQDDARLDLEIMRLEFRIDDRVGRSVDERTRLDRLDQVLVGVDKADRVSRTALPETRKWGQANNIARRIVSETVVLTFDQGLAVLGDDQRVASDGLAVDPGALGVEIQCRGVQNLQVEVSQRIADQFDDPRGWV